MQIHSYSFPRLPEIVSHQPLCHDVLCSVCLFTPIFVCLSTLSLPSSSVWFVSSCTYFVSVSSTQLDKWWCGDYWRFICLNGFWWLWLDYCRRCPCMRCSFRRWSDLRWADPDCIYTCTTPVVYLYGFLFGGKGYVFVSQCLPSFPIDCQFN